MQFAAHNMQFAVTKLFYLNTLILCKLHPLDSLFFNNHERATGSVLTSDKEEKHAILPTTLNFAVRRGKLRISTLLTPSEVFCKFSPPEGYKKYAVVSFE